MSPSILETFSSALYSVLSSWAEQNNKELGIQPADLQASLHQPKQAEHGDLATGIALRLAKPMGAKPAELATAWAVEITKAEHLKAMLQKVEVAGPGFINFRLTNALKVSVVARVLAEGERFGHRPEGSAGSVLLEYVSANPTGPLHVGHGRQAALGDSLANVLASQGFRVHREFYYNDAGTQIENLALSVAARARGVSPDDPAFPADGYRGDYIAEIAKSYLAKETVCAAGASPVQALGDPFQIEAVRAYSVAYLRREQDMDLAAFGVRFDRFSLESALYSSGAVESVVREVVRLGHAYEQDGALWLRSTSYGDDKDRVMRKSSGGFTYFVPDVAYHLEKYKRGYSKAINIQGADHHGTIARVRAGLQALEQGIPKDFPDYILHKMVTVMRGGEEVKISKRAGAYVTLRDLIDWSGGRDAVRFFLVSRKADSEFVFDVDLAVSKSEENPVYYVQYAHARIAGVLAQAGYANVSEAREWARSLQDSDLTERLDKIQHPKALALCARMSLYPSMLGEAAEQHSPHVVAFYLRELAADLHGFYNAERILVDAMVERESRLLLLLAAAAVISSGLKLLGVSAPERM